VLRLTGVRDARVHDARHTAATLLLASGVDTRTLKDLTGWTEFRTPSATPTSSTRCGAMARMGGVLFRQAECGIKNSGFRALVHLAAEWF
jgi:integrase